MDHNLEFFFELPEVFRPFGITPGSTSKKEVYGMIESGQAILLAPEAPARTQDNLLDPNQTEMALGGLKDIFGFPLKGLLVHFYKETVDKVFCVFETGDDPEAGFSAIVSKLESDIFGMSSGVKTSDDEEDISVSWPFRWFSISLLLYRPTTNLLLLFSDKSLERTLAESEKETFKTYFDDQMKGPK